MALILEGNRIDRKTGNKKFYKENLKYRVHKRKIQTEIRKLKENFVIVIALQIVEF